MIAVPLQVVEQNVTSADVSSPGPAAVIGSASRVLAVSRTCRAQRPAWSSATPEAAEGQPAETSGHPGLPPELCARVRNRHAGHDRR